MFAKKTENSSSTIKWSESGDSFIIYNIENFVKILPLYFKTKNYSSFVRQLNMYNFHKIKNVNGNMEFMHDTLTKNLRNNLDSFSRRPNEEMRKTEKIEKENDKSYLLELDRIKKASKELEESIITLSQQTDSLVCINKDLIGQIYNSKKGTDISIRKLLFLYFALLTNSEPEILKTFTRAYFQNASTNTNSDEQKIMLDNFDGFIKGISKNILFSNEDIGGNIDRLFQSMSIPKDLLFSDGKLPEAINLKFNLDFPMGEIGFHGNEQKLQWINFKENESHSGMDDRSEKNDESFWNPFYDLSFQQNGNELTDCLLNGNSKQVSQNNLENSFLLNDSRSDIGDVSPRR